MSESEKIPDDRYVEIRYLQFTAPRSLRLTMAALGVLTWPLVLPMALVSRVSEIIFRTCSELLAFLPYFPGVVLRYEFYRFALNRCGRNVLIETGAMFIHRDVEIGSNVLIGRYSIIHHVRIGNDVLIGDRCTLLSGSRQHHYKLIDVPINQQGGAKKRIVVADDCWLGSHALIMSDIGKGAIVAAGAVVTQAVEPYSIVGGVPARPIGNRMPAKGSPD